MKKIIFLLCFTTLLFFCKKDEKTVSEEVDSEKTNSQWVDFELNGNVKSTLEYTTEEKRDNENTSSVRKFENQFSPDIALKFDEKGKLVNKISYSEDGNVSEDIIYDGKDKIISIKNFTNAKDFVETKYTWDNNKNTIITRRFNGLQMLDKEVFLFENGKKIEKYKYDSHENQADRTSYSYDNDNRVTEEIYFQGKPIMQSRLSIEYDNNGNKSIEIIYNKDFKVITKTTYEYDGSNQLIYTKTYTDNGSLDAEQFRTYDDKNRLISKGSFEVFDNSNNKEDFEYDENDNTTSWKIYKNQKLLSKTTYTFDLKNNLTSETTTSPDGKELHKKIVEYTYDKNGNWVTRKSTIDQLVLYTSRKVEYYK
ncbi:hypothetical protein [uncultured Flavobacterium sp.]|uniref:RHS repeat domain-containing protein n=1 Tax=uncultured Flavobacterium sp. TaxID=165435 RepID=UPI0030EBE475|tara:strand:+ start:44690 stop:45787 length:1098 start_codon:yes stop_codon:yes gene_type:complete